MKLARLLLISLASLAAVSCSPMTPADYAKSKAEQQAEYPEFAKRYQNGSTSAEIAARLRKVDHAALLGKRKAERPAAGWDSRSWEQLEEQAGGHRVESVERYSFGGIKFLAAEVYHHRIYYDRSGRSIGWYVTHD